ncbi:MAG TPA: hypothetical protein VGO47_12930 [Chlamydiales bacterium]|nr:hypothetical protein [Chlamydiales bacterium]
MTGTGTNLSWWPKQGAWASSGLNVGYWSADCEEWFRNRLASIKDGTAQLRSATEWKKGLRFRGTQTKKLKEGAIDLAKTFLSHNNVHK